MLVTVNLWASETLYATSRIPRHHVCYQASVMADPWSRRLEQIHRVNRWAANGPGNVLYVTS